MDQIDFSKIYEIYSKKITSLDDNTINECNIIPIPNFSDLHDNIENKINMLRYKNKLQLKIIKNQRKQLKEIHTPLSTLIPNLDKNEIDDEFIKQLNVDSYEKIKDIMESLDYENSDVIKQYTNINLIPLINTYPAVTPREIFMKLALIKKLVFTSTIQEIIVSIQLRKIARLIGILIGTKRKSFDIITIEYGKKNNILNFSKCEDEKMTYMSQDLHIRSIILFSLYGETINPYKNTTTKTKITFETNNQKFIIKRNKTNTKFFKIVNEKNIQIHIGKIKKYIGNIDDYLKIYDI
jgi:hypothetical protein